MKIILSKEIISFLKKESIHYECNEELLNKYTIASLFMPIENGFYFFVGEEVPDTVSKSAILLNRSNSNNLKNGNIGIYLIDSDPQQVFYRLLSSVYKTQSNGIISDTAIIHPEAKIGKNVQIDDFVVVDRAVIEDNVIIRSHSFIHNNSIVRKNVTIENHSVIGAQGVAWIWDEQGTEKIIQPQLGGVDIGTNCFLGAGTILVRGSLNENSKIGKNTLLAPGCRIGHGTQIGEYVHFANNIITGGNTIIGNYCFVGSGAVFRSKVKIHANTIVGAGAVVVKNTTENGKTLIGIPAVEKETKEHPSGMPKPILKN
ncbi:MAG: UDP-3-O-[3-hydroxymyristoyl] glucosamine N-acyltransferase [Parvicella sp.]|jgi:UDP-3-O-[3-hydroxymyristoyl] glucosamine N-acyltransferase|tara:strand:+ start:584 stop:1528 length:945 start_codon:yes stop_codon:yes gene_type:complete